MGKVYSHMVMSLDGYIASPEDGIDELFEWYGVGEVSVPTHNEGIELSVDEDSAAMLRDYMSTTGALVCGRRLFDITQGWGDSHPVGAPVVVVTHRKPDDAEKWKSITFADGVESGIAQAKETAAGKDVVIASADIAGQALDLGLVDEVHASLAPVLLGEGIPYFANLKAAPHRLEDPRVIRGKRATHLLFPVRR